MADINTVLQNLGLNDKESNIYLALLELGSGTIQEVAQKSGVKRTNIYNLVGPLKEKGLITEIKQDQKTILVPENPHTLIKRAEENLKKVKEIMPEFLGIFNTPGTKPKVKFYEGVEGIKKTYDVILEAEQNIYGFLDIEKMQDVLGLDYLLEWAGKRTKKGVKYLGIAKDGPSARLGMKRNKDENREMKLIKDLNFETEINIYGNQVAIISFRRPYMGVVIEDQAVANTLKSIWKGWWNNLK